MTNVILALKMQLLENHFTTLITLVVMIVLSAFTRMNLIEFARNVNQNVYRVLLMIFVLNVYTDLINLTMESACTLHVSRTSTESLNLNLVAMTAIKHA